MRAKKSTPKFVNSKASEITIAEAARTALRRIGRPSSIREIYDKISQLGLYQFNTPVPEHVLRTEIRRKTEGVERVDSSKDMMFRLAGDEIYDVMKETTKRRGTVGMKRIHRAIDKESIIQILTSDSVGVFKEIWRLLLFAAVLGFSNQRREPLSSVETGKGIDQLSFGNNPVWPGLLYLLGLVDSDDTQVLKSSEESEDERVQIFEEYANGGLAILKEEFEARNCSLEALLTFIHAKTNPVSVKPPDLELTI